MHARGRCSARHARLPAVRDLLSFHPEGALYNTLLVEGLARAHEVAFLCGTLAPVQDLVAARRVTDHVCIHEQNVRFPELFEREQAFQPALARYWYGERVAEPSNPVYQALADDLRRVVAHTTPAVVNTHNLNAACTFVRAFASGPRPRVVVTIHDVERRQLAFLADHQATVDVIVAISCWVERALLQAGIAPSRIRTIPNGVDLAPFLDLGSDVVSRWSSIARRNGLVPNAAFRVLVPARRVPGKGIEAAIRGFDAFVRHSGRKAQLLITGAGTGTPSYEAHLRHCAAKTTCAGSVHFLGPLSYDEMPVVFANADISLLPSVVPEGFAYVNIEAMATGRPVVVASAAGGCLDYLDDHRNSLLVTPGDVDAIASMLAFVDSNPARATQIVAAGRTTAQRYSATSMVRAYERVLFPRARDRFNAEEGEEDDAQR